jgi:hypothetical protein
MTSRADSGEAVLAMYRPKAGKDAAVRDVIAKHVASLREWGLATARPATLLQARDGTYVEIFEWVPGGAERAHQDPRVMEIWDRFSAVCDFVSLKDLPDAERPFPHFRAVDGVTI